VSRLGALLLGQTSKIFKMWFSKMWINRSIQNRLTKKNLFSKFQNNNFWARKSIFKLASPFPIWNSWKISMYRQFRRTDAKIHLISKSSYYNILSQRHIWTHGGSSWCFVAWHLMDVLLILEEILFAKGLTDAMYHGKLVRYYSKLTQIGSNESSSNALTLKHLKMAVRVKLKD
jgi:hypothetical protein